MCMALNGFYEARSEPLDGRIAVALVVRNRAEQFQTSICWEVFRDNQFTWANDSANLRTLPAGPKWDDALEVARLVMAGAPDFTSGATYYHTKAVRPRWAKAKIRVGVWGAHIFYREPK